MSSHKIGRVYRIVCLCDPAIQYVGSTFNQLRHRFMSHKRGFKEWIKNGNTSSTVSIFTYFEKHGIENFRMILIKEYNVYANHVKDSKHLHAYEQLWINKLKCINKIAAFGIDCLIRKSTQRVNSKSEYDKLYNATHKERISARRKTYNDAHKNESKLYNKIYVEKNKAKRKAQQTKPYNCKCGCIIQTSAKSGHLKSQKHLTFMANTIILV
jgi:hypothetical protein